MPNMNAFTIVKYAQEIEGNVEGILKSKFSKWSEMTESGNVAAGFLSMFSWRKWTQFEQGSFNAWTSQWDKNQ